MEADWLSIIQIMWIVIPILGLMIVMQWPESQAKFLLIIFLGGRIAVQIGYKFLDRVGFEYAYILSVVSILLQFVFLCALFNLGMMLSEKNSNDTL